MKICWDNLEKYGIYLTKCGNFKDAIQKRTFYYQEECIICKEPFLSRNKTADTCTKKCLGKAFTGENNPFYGKIHTKETKENISKNRKGKCTGDNHPAKRPEVAKKISDSKKGEKHHYWGKRGKDTANWKGGYRAKKLPLYDTYTPQIEWCEEVRRDPNDKNLLQVKCVYCGKWFTPSSIAVFNRLGFLKEQYKNENRFYCSDGCKTQCPVYHKQEGTILKEQKIRNGKDPWWILPREIQPDLRKMCFKRDKYQCIKCGSKKELNCHHIEGLLWEPLQSADLDMVITVCNKCHKEIHKKDGCTYDNMKCK